jgi:hypothetical protein
MGNRFEAFSEQVLAKQLEQNELSPADRQEIAHLGV